MALLALRPAVADFIDTIAYARGRKLQLENVDIGKHSLLAGQTVKTARDETRVAVLAMPKNPA